MNKLHPRISVIMPINKDDGFFASALDSVLNQSFKDFELIIVANQCDDKLWEQILKINDDRVFPKRVCMGGLAFALNFGAIHARGEYIARMDADDICLPNRLLSQLSFMDMYPNVDVLGGRVTLINSDGNVLNEVPAFYETHAEIVSTLPYRNPLVHPAVFLRKEILINSGGYKFGFTGEDYELWIRLMLAGKKFHNLNEEVLLYRRHESQMTGSDKSHLIFCDVSAILLMYFLKTKNFLFLFGVLSKIPFVRKIRNIFLKF